MNSLRRSVRLVVPLALPLLLAEAAASQDGFLFGAPVGQITVRGGAVQYTANGDLLEFTRAQLTLDRDDFRAANVFAEGTAFLSSRLALGFGAGFSSMEADSEFRDWEGDDGLPIAQTTTLRVVPVILSARYYLVESGTEVSRLAWIPTRTTPYVGAAAGYAWHSFRQVGDFIRPDMQIIPESYAGSGWSGIAQILAGVDHWMTPRVGAGLEGRYTWGSARPGGDFQTWDSVDLGGFQLNVGLSYRW